MANNNSIDIQLFGKQYDAFNFKTQFGAAIAGVQSGKTFVGSIFAGTKIQEFPTDNGIIAAPSYSILQQSTMEKFWQNFPQLRRYYNKSEHVIYLPTGGKVFCRSMDDPLSVEGITAKWAWGDEAGQWSRFGWTVFRSRLSMTEGQGFLTTTPYNLGWLFTDFYMAWKKGLDKDLSVFSWASIENPNFPKAFYEAERMRLTPEEFARRYQGAFSKMEGLVYNLAADQIIEPCYSKLNIKDVIIGMDFGFNVPSAIIVIAITNDNVAYIIDEFYAAGKLQEELEDEVLAFKQKYPISQLYPDSAEPDRIESMKRKFKSRGIMVKVVDKNVPLGIEAVRSKVNKKQLYVFNTCKYVIDEFEQYHYDEDKETPVKKNDHAMDAVKYALYNYAPIKIVPASGGVIGGVKPFVPGMPG